jgi:hypothetical protein
VALSVNREPVGWLICVFDAGMGVGGVMEALKGPVDWLFVEG